MDTTKEKTTERDWRLPPRENSGYHPADNNGCYRSRTCDRAGEKAGTETTQVIECEMPDGRKNTVEYEIETVIEGNIIWHIKRPIAILNLEVSGKEWREYCLSKLQAFLEKRR